MAVRMVVFIAFLLGTEFVPYSSVKAEDVLPQDVHVVTPAYKPEFKDFEPSLGTYVYDVSWQGIPAAEVQLQVEEDEGKYYRITTFAKTYSGIDLFYKLRYRAEGLIASSNLLPLHTVIDHRENSKVKNIQITFKDGDISSVRSQVGKATEVTKFHSDNLTLDPFSAAFLARSLEWKKGDIKEFDTFNGKTRYLISLTATDLIKLKVNGSERDVWVIVPTVKRLTGDLSKKSDKLREAKIYVTADKAREVLKIKSEVFVGSVTTQLESFTPSNNLPAGTQVAKHTTRVFFD